MLLEEQLATQGREKQVLRERIEQAELGQKELVLAKLEVLPDLYSGFPISFRFQNSFD